MRAGLQALVLAGLLSVGSAAAAGERVVTVDLAGSSRSFNRSLGGVTQGSANPAVNAALASIRVPHIRIDTWFEQGGVDCTNPPDFTAIDARVANVRAAGAEPLVIIDYMPRCLSRYTGPSFGGQPDPVHQPPADYALWEELVYATVRHLARDLGVRWFEAWNEPNLPQFFQGTILDYLELFDSIESAVRRVETDDPPITLQFGGPATAFPDPVWMPAFLAHVALENRQLDFVSWHWYANYPLFGPIFTTPLGTIPPLNVENPLLKPRDYADHTAVVRQWVTAAWALRRDGAPPPLLWIDEWNLNAGRDPRHDTAEDAAFAAAALGWMLRGGLDRATFFNVEDATDPNFNQGMFFFHRGSTGPADGTPKPVFATFDFWSRMESQVVPLSVGPIPDLGIEGFEQFLLQEDNVGGIASRSADGRHATILLYNWTPRLKRQEPLRVEITGAAGAVTGTLMVLPSNASTGLDVAAQPVTGAVIPLTLEDSSVAFLDLAVAP